MIQEIYQDRTSLLMNVSGINGLPLTPCLRAAYVPLTFPLTPSSQEGLWELNITGLDLDYLLNFFTLERL